MEESIFSVLLIFVAIKVAQLSATSFQCPLPCNCWNISLDSIPGISVECLKADTLDTIPQTEQGSADILKIVIRDQNGLTQIKKENLQNYVNLRWLEISSTNLSFLPDDVFASTPFISRLHLGGNRLEFLSKTCINHLNLTELILDGNPLLCICKNAWLGNGLYRLLIEKNLTCLNQPTSSVNMNRNHTYNIGSRSGIYDDLVLMEDKAMDTRWKDIAKFDGDSLCGSINISIQPSDISFNKGSSVNITCEVSGQHRMEVSWMFPTGLGSEFVIKDIENHQSVLLIRSLNVSDHYKQCVCVADNGAKREQKTFIIHVNHPPEIKTIYKWPKETLRYIYFKVSGWPKPDFTWYKNNGIDRSVPHVHDYVRAHPGVDGMWVGKREWKTSLSYVVGNYTLVATNALGSSNKTVEITGHHSEPLKHGDWLYDLEEDDTLNFNQPKNVSTMSVTNSNSKTLPLYATCLLALLGGSLALLLFIVVAMIVRRRRIKRHVRGQTERCKHTKGNKFDDFRESVPLNTSTTIPMVDNPNYEFQVKQILEEVKTPNYSYIKLENIFLIEQIGEGHFGKVVKGKCADLIKKNEFTDVAIKTLKALRGKGENNEEKSIRQDFEKEAELLSSLNHPNVVTLFGVCIEGEQPMMVFEFMENGDLNNYLRANGPHSAFLHPPRTPHTRLETKQLLNIVVQIARGMDYLASQHFVHRDLATRNCLVGKSHDVKIGDFGMSKDVYSTDYYRVGGAAMEMPVRWMAPESILYRTFTTKSDIWSYGVTIWEVFMFGAQPWFQYSNGELMEKIKSGFSSQLSIPSQCPSGVYNIMLGCWQVNPADRITMKEIIGLLHLEMEHGDGNGSPSYIKVIE